jgi:hypothetical protein
MWWIFFQDIFSNLKILSSKKKEYIKVHSFLFIFFPYAQNFTPNKGWVAKENGFLYNLL